MVALRRRHAEASRRAIVISDMRAARRAELAADAEFYTQLAAEQHAQGNKGRAATYLLRAQAAARGWARLSP